MGESVDLAEEAGRQKRAKMKSKLKNLRGSRNKKTLNARLTEGEQFKRMEEIL